MSGDRIAGEALNPIHVLAARFGTTPATIQRAQDLLKEQGYLAGIRGKGVFVRHRKPFVVGDKAYFDPNSTDYSYRVLRVGRERPPADAAELLGLPSGGVAALRYRLMRHFGDPVELSWSYYPLDLAAGTDLESPLQIRGGAPRVLAEAGEPEHEVVDRLSARMATSEEVRELRLPAEVPILRTLRVIFSESGRPVEASVLVQGAHLYELSFRHSAH